MTGTVNPPPGAFLPRLPRARADRTPDNFSFVRAAGSEDWRTLEDWMAEVRNTAGSVNVTSPPYNAKGDGSTNDSAAIQAADTAARLAGRPLHFPTGTYAASGLAMTTGWHMAPGATILYNGATEGECVRCSGTGLVSGDIRIDCDGKEPRTAFYLDGDENEFGLVLVKNAVSTNQVWIVRSIYVTGDNNTIRESRVEDLVNSGNSNDSSPQGLVTDGTADLNSFGRVFGRNARSTVVNAGSGDNFYGEVTSIDANDNGFYSVGGNAFVGSIFYDGDDNVCGFRSDANVSIGSIHVARSGSTSVFFGDCGDISIGSIFVNNNGNAILHLNLADTGRIRIGSITGSLTNSQVFAMPAASGDVAFLSIDYMDLVVNVTNLAAFSQPSFMILTACKGINFGRIKVDVILTGISTPTFFYSDFNAALTYKSHIDSYRVGMFDSDGVTTHANCTFFARYAYQTKMYIAEGVLDSNNSLRQYNTTGFRSGKLVGAQSVTIASGVVTITRPGVLVVDTESAASTDDLDTITFADVQVGDVLLVVAANNARDVVLKDATGNLRLPADLTLTHGQDTAMLFYSPSGVWQSVAPIADNTA